MSRRYREMAVSEGVEHVMSCYSTKELKTCVCFADLHRVRDANMTLPFHEDVGVDEWLKFANAVIDSIDRDLESNNSGRLRAR